jgi:hypothetical protein
MSFFSFFFEEVIAGLIINLHHFKITSMMALTIKRFLPLRNTVPQKLNLETNPAATRR